MSIVRCVLAMLLREHTDTHSGGSDGERRALGSAWFLQWVFELTSAANSTNGDDNDGSDSNSYMLGGLSKMGPLQKSSPCFVKLLCSVSVALRISLCRGHDSSSVALVKFLLQFVKMEASASAAAAIVPDDHSTLLSVGGEEGTKTLTKGGTHSKTKNDRDWIGEKDDRVCERSR